MSLPSARPRWTALLASAALLLCVLSTRAAAQNTFGFTISNSTTDPLSTSGAIAPGPNQFTGNLYLWFYCSEEQTGLSAAEFDVVELQGGGPPIAFNPAPGFLNAGTASQILLAAGGCPTGPALAGAFVVGADALVPDIELCLVPSASRGRNTSLSCSQELFNNGWQGFRKAAAPCGTLPVCVVSPVLMAYAGSNRTIALGDTTQLGGSPTATGGTPPYDYSWSPSTGLDDPTAANPLAFPTTTSFYTLQVIDDAFASALAFVLVTVEQPPVAAPDVGTDASDAVRAHPNPFRESTEVTVPDGFRNAMRVEVLDAAGRRVRSLAPGSAGGDAARITWDGRDGDGRAVPAGVYFVRIRSSQGEATIKVLRVR